MKIVEINGTNYSSTGNIMLSIASKARKEGFEVFTCCKDSKKSREFSYENQIYIGNRFERIFSECLAYLTGYGNYFNIIGTKKFLKKLDTIKPDLIHLHVMHDTYINLELLFSYIKDNNIPVVWTMHDCWAFTGKCPYFDSANCNKWVAGCYKCSLLKKYPETKMDKTKLLWNKKKEWFNVNNMTIVTPSNWLANLVKKSFLRNHTIQVINNGIDLNRFMPVQSNLKEQYKINDKYVVLGVGYNWSDRKGLDALIELSKRLNNNYKIVLVGTNVQIDKILPNNIISIHRTYSQKELIKIYSIADVFVNPTKEDNFPTVNIEALACGIPVITYNTGGSIEAIDNKTGVIVNKGDIDSLVKETIRICESKPFNKEDCINRAKEFNSENKYLEYVELYKRILNV